MNSKKQPLRIHENILVFYREQCVYNPQMRLGFKPYETTRGKVENNYRESKSVTTKSNGERYPISVLKFNRDKNKIHPTQKPIKLLEFLIKTYTNIGDIILDNCMGSGSTGVACKNLNRKFIGIEKEKQYFEIAKRRIENFEKEIEYENLSLF